MQTAICQDINFKDSTKDLLIFVNHNGLGTQRNFYIWSQRFSKGENESEMKGQVMKSIKLKNWIYTLLWYKKISLTLVSATILKGQKCIYIWEDLHHFVNWQEKVTNNNEFKLFKGVIWDEYMFLCIFDVL